MDYLNAQIEYLALRLTALEQDHMQFVTEVPEGTINGVNTTFRLPVPPILVQVYLNGLMQREGVDYTLDGRVVEMTSPPEVGDDFEAKLVLYSYTYRAKSAQRGYELP